VTTRAKQRLLILLLIAAALGVAWLASGTRQPPLLPVDDAHARGAGGEPCLACHGPGGELPRGADHPLGNDCLRCHGSTRASALGLPVTPRAASLLADGRSQLPAARR
jgi:hypothetical protein